MENYKKMKYEAYTHSNGGEITETINASNLNEAKRTLVLVTIQNMPDEDLDSVLEVFDLHVREMS